MARELAIGPMQEAGDVSKWVLIQIVFDLFAALGLFVAIMRISRTPKDDPRLSRGLQLLQSKIAVLEDLSDRSEAQVNQLTAILEQKSREVHAKVQLAEQSVNEIRISMERSLEVAKIFQDKIPHKEIIERQNTIKYVTAARLAHQGLSVDEIAAETDLPKGEVEFIASVNRDRLMFNEDQLPEWARAARTGVESSVAFTGEGTPAAPSSHPSYRPATEIEESRAHVAAAETAARLQAEIELAERQKLVENLSRLQVEIKSLDRQLARDGASLDLQAAFEPPRMTETTATTLQRLGDEFKKAVHGTTSSAAPAPQAATPFTAVPLTAAPPAPPITTRAATTEIKTQPTLETARQMARQVSAPVPRPMPTPAPAKVASSNRAVVQSLATSTVASTPAVQPHHVMSAVTRSKGQPIIKKVLFPSVSDG